MPISVRLGSELESRLAAASRRLHMHKSEVIKRSLEAYLDQVAPAKSAFDLGEDLFGIDDSAGPSVARNYKRLVGRKLRAKYTG